MPRALTTTPTGQSKHALNILLCLSRRPDVQLTLLAARDQLTTDRRMPPDSPLSSLPVTPIPFPSKALHYLWRTCRWPKIERWCGAADWIYCPTEMFVAARRTRLASTIHSADWFENDLPWSNTRENLRARERVRTVFRPIFAQARLLLTVSEFLKSRLMALFGLPESRLTVIGNGVEDCFFRAGNETPRPSNARPQPGYLLTVGALQPRKGAGCLFRLAHTLARRGSKLKILVAGGNLGIPALVKEAEHFENIELLGYVPSRELAGLMRNSVAVLVPSRYETFAIPALEAMAAGAPVIASHFAALPEIVGDAAILVNPDDPEAVADSSITLANDAALRRRLVTTGRVRAMQHTWETCAQRLVNALRATIGQPPSRPTQSPNVRAPIP